jgi:SAM-dependent methyltransferase
VISTFEDFMLWGMDRRIAQPIPLLGGIQLNIGAGHKLIPGTVPLDLPQYNADKDPIPYKDGEVAAIYAFHFLEHVKHPIEVLREMERVLMPNGVINIVVPHYMGTIAYQDLDHRHFFTIETWKTLFNNPYYDKGREVPWRLHIHYNVIAGVAERNLALFTQLVKDS